MDQRSDTSRLGIAVGRRGPGTRRAAFSLVELLLVIALMLILAWFVVPVFTGELDRRHLEYSIDQVQSLLRSTRAQAMNDGKRYRICWPDEDAYEQTEENGKTLQPVLEVEADPIDEPGVFTEVKAVWARGDTLYEGIQCKEVRIGRPTLPEEEELQEELDSRFDQIADGIEEMFEEEEDPFDEMFGDDPDEIGSEEDEDAVRPPIVFEPDGTVEWATIFLTNGEEDEEGELLTWEIVVDGRTGSVGYRRTPSEAQIEEMVAQKQEEREQKTIVRGREVGAR